MIKQIHKSKITQDLNVPLDIEKRFKLYTGSGNPALAQRIADELGVELSGLTIEKFSNGEIYARFDESVRGADVFFVQSLVGDNVNDLVMETLITADAAHRASCRTFTAVIPHYAYARQDRKAAPREPITARLIANLLETSGVSRVVAVDLHQNTIQGFFDVPVNHLSALDLFATYYEELALDKDNLVVVSPDVGRAKAAKMLSDKLDCGFAVAHKGRPRHNAAAITGIIGDIKDKICIVNDDMIDTAGTLCASVRELKNMGASDVYVCATHGLFTGNGMNIINEAPIVECVVTDTVPLENREVSPKIKMISVAPQLADCITRIYNETPVSSMYGADNNL